MVIKIEILNDTVLDLLRNLEKLQLIKFDNAVTKVSQRQKEAEFEKKILASKSSKISYHFKGNELNELVDNLLAKTPVDLEKYKIIKE
jgi:hypothetical protein